MKRSERRRLMAQIVRQFLAQEDAPKCKVIPFPKRSERPVTALHRHLARAAIPKEE